MFSLRLLVSLCNLNYLQVSVKGKYQRNKIKQQQKNKIKIKKIDQSIAKFFLLHSLVLQYLIIPLKYQLSIIKKNSERYNEIVFYKKVIRKIFTIFTEKPLCWSLFLNKNAGLQCWNFIKKRLLHRFFPVNIARFLRTPVFKSICERLFERFTTWANNITGNTRIEEDISSKTKQKKGLKFS